MVYLATSETPLADELPMMKSESIFKIEEGLDGDVDAFTMADSSGLVIKTDMKNGQNKKVKMRTPESVPNAIYFPGKASWKCTGDLANDGYIYMRNMNVGGEIMTEEDPDKIFPYLGIDGVDYLNLRSVSESSLTPESAGWVPTEMEC